MNHSIETQIKLNSFTPRPYQIPLYDAIENKGYKKVMYIAPRRSGKDLVAFNIAIRYALENICVIYYCFPTFSLARRALWDNITIDGMRVLDYIPDEIIESKNEQQMRIKFRNGSIIQLIGSDNYNETLIGTNPKMIIFSEYALQDPMAYQFARPILAANNGVALFVSTPRGKNHMWELYQIALQSPEWFAYKLTIDDTKHLSDESWEEEKRSYSEDLLQQEYFCSFELGVEGTIYGKYIDKLKLRGQIGCVPWENSARVHTAWDIGRDTTSIIFFQTIGQVVRVIDYFEKANQNLAYFVGVLENKPYLYGKHFFPHDMSVTEWAGPKITRLDKVKELGLKDSHIVPNVSIEDGIEHVRTSLSNIWIDEKNCAHLVKALENYRRVFDDKKRVYGTSPLHDWSSHACFTGDTKVLTRYAMRQIMDIEENDEVLTLSGWKKCSKAFMTRKNANLVEVKFKDGTIVKCTPDHMFLTERGWRSAESLEMGSMILSSLIQSQDILMEESIESGPMNDTLRASPTYIEMFGEMLSDLFRKTVISITAMKTLKTIDCGILNAFPEMNIWHSREKTTKDLPIKQEWLPKNGINLKRVSFGISDIQSEFRVGLNGSERKRIVSIVIKSLTALLERMGIVKNTATPIAKPQIISAEKILEIESVTPLNKKEDVWCINVPEEKHFSLSNGAVVHNCDAFRYMCLSLSKTRQGLTAEELDKRYLEARYGYQANMPPIFQDRHTKRL